MDFKSQEKSRKKTPWLGLSWLALGLCGLCCAPLVVTGLIGLVAGGAMLRGEVVGFLIALALLSALTLWHWRRSRKPPACDI